MAKMKIKKGDLVQVITGRTSDADKAASRGLKAGDKGKQGRVLQVFPETERVLVEGVNRRTHHLRPTQAGGAGGIEQREAPIHVSNVALVDPEDNKPTKVGFRVETIELENGRSKQTRVRFSKRSGKDI
ncbi:50S ribosomal protein L24 [Brachybacterium muris]|uniref:Large ribosomal subunit protein uL24 n=2 Tax=Bacteria TaxID=2 RepID=A0A022L1F0_9MICO|nr:50S ribosomal protein L24 [Brachybacterium muris]PZP17573.1 MAG: 50S ribosomal protein L24 [Brachybacterium faecium]EYT51101.1 50S ribosomal protein L24 [Brachybacterium muris UCD-AY4]MBM7501615.1 large subunit ribosomal protein L24 [Brachybacterium muris]MCT1431150.1 50S ribosomal protein L24 [Brachybacterium muris]MCT1998712.1 50S ribosomal protein L24 [Brachybacterium muris]